MALISFLLHVFEIWHSGNPLLCPMANLFCGCLLVGLWPRCLSGLLFFWRNANLAGGFAGGRGCGLVVFVWFIYDLPRYIAELASRSLSHSAGVSRFVACWFLVVLLCLVWFLFAFSFIGIVTALWTMYRSMPAHLLRLSSIAYVNALISQFILFATCNRTC